MSSRLVTRLEEGTRLAAQTARHYCTQAQSELRTLLAEAKRSPKAALYTGLGFGAWGWRVAALIRHVRGRRARQNITQPSTPNLEKRSPFKAPERPFGGKHIHMISYLIPFSLHLSMSKT